MSEVERQHFIDDFLDDTFGDTNANPELVAMLRAMRPELPDDPEPHTVKRTRPSPRAGAAVNLVPR
jgi:hypothetical protein